MKVSKKLGFEAMVLGACLFLGTALPATGIRTQDPQQPAADNTKNNKGDQSSGAMTADKQKMNPADRDLTKKIRAGFAQRCVAVDLRAQHQDHQPGRQGHAEGAGALG